MQLKVERIKMKHIFLLFSLLFGLMWMVVLPPYQAPDEVSHFLRAYMIADGNMMCKNVNGSNAGAYFPTSVKELSERLGSDKISFHPEVKQDVHALKDVFHLKLTDEKVFIELPGSCVYNPISYVPQVLGILLGKMLNLPVLVIFYLGRLCNLLLYAFIMYHAIHLIPRLKSAAMLLALTPMAIHQAASLSADGVTISASFLLICYILHLTNQNYVHNRQLVYVGLLGIVVTLAKIVYFPLVWLFCLIPMKSIGSKKKYTFAGLTICGVSLFVFALWMVLVRTVHVVFPVDPKAQLIIILTHPFAFIYKLLHTLFTEAGSYYNQFFGVFGWLDTPMPTLLGLGFLMTLAISVWAEKEENELSHSMKGPLLRGGWMFCIFLLSVVLIEVTLFLNFSKPDEDIVIGVQGRYFLPVSLLFFYSLYYLKSSIQRYWYHIIILGTLFTFVVCSYFLFIRYYAF